MSTGVAHRMVVNSAHALSRCIRNQKPNEAIALGVLRADLPDRVEITIKADLTRRLPEPNIISRSAGQIVYRAGCPAWALIDFDTKAMPPDVREAIAAAGGFVQSLEVVLPELGRTAHGRRSSTSSGLVRSDTGEAVEGSSGVRLYLIVKDGADIERFLRVLHARCWLAGFEWMMVGAGGQLLERSIIDRVVGRPERLVFEATPILEPPLAQDAIQREQTATEGEVLDTYGCCAELSVVEHTRFGDLRRVEERRLMPAARIGRETFIKALMP